MKLCILDFNRTLYDPEREQLYEGALELLRDLRLRGVRLALWTRDERGRMEHIQRSELTALLDEICVSSTKDVASLKTLAEQFDVSMEDTVVVTDPVRTDLQSANEAGAITVSIKQGRFVSDMPYTPQEQPDYEVSTIAEAHGLLLSLL